MRRIVFRFLSVLLLAWTVLFGWDFWVNAHRIVEGPENESALYRSYDPEQVIKLFRYERESYGSGHGYGAAQLVTYIHHSQEFTPRFTMQANLGRELLHALREDILYRLRDTGMTVVATNDEADGGFTYKYTSQNIRGSISVQAPVRRMTVRRYSVPRGLDDVEIKIALEETWTRPANQLAWWMSAVD